MAGDSATFRRAAIWYAPALRTGKEFRRRVNLVERNTGVFSIGKSPGYGLLHLAYRAPTHLSPDAIFGG